MLRTGVVLVGAALVLAASLAFLAGGSFGAILWLAAAGGILLAGTLFERVRYKPVVDEPPGPDWIDTGERFIEPGTGRLVRVFSQPETGERRYVDGRLKAPARF